MKINLVIPMAGMGSRFSKKGYSLPKPLIPINGIPMIKLVIDNIKIDNLYYIFIVREEDYHKYNLDHLLNEMTNNKCKIIIDCNPIGAATSAYLAKEYIDNDDPLLIANSDQKVDFDFDKLLNEINKDIDGSILVFEDNQDKWSYVKLNGEGYVSEVVEKKVISNLANCGIYFWKKGKYFIDSTQEMIKMNDKFNNEFYIAPTYNYLIKKNKKISILKVDKMWGLGTPEDLDYYIKNIK